MKKSYYRPDIDGLRALAIVPVVLFHAGVVGFSGGYVGVDIFFVISGFLITSILLREHREGRFSFFSFWERRVRRIAPALVVVLTTTIIVACILLLFPDDMLGFGKSLIAQSIFLSNVLFMRRDGYFATASETGPLLHTWTLSVEEQFYIILPILLFLVWKYLRTYTFHILALIALLSFAYNIATVALHPGDIFSIPFIPDAFWRNATNQSAGFFFLFTRAWELLLGALLATGSFAIRSQRLAEVTSVVGMGAILFAITQLHEGTLFPGFAALLPVLGAAAIIAANTHTTTYVGSLLSLRWCVAVGLISYSLYLWHWPVFFFADIALDQHTILTTVALIVLSVLLALATYHFIEQPFGKRKYLPNKKMMVTTGLTSLLLLVCVGYLLLFVDTTSRAPDYARAVLAEEAGYGPRHATCYKHRHAAEYDAEGPCVLGSASSTPSFVLWGDSHAGAVFDVVDQLASRQSISGAFFGASACVPVPHTSPATPLEECDTRKNLALTYIRENDIRHIVLAARWNYYISEQAREKGHLMTDEHSRRASVEDARRVFKTQLTDMLTTLGAEDRQVYILKQLPEHTHFDLRHMFYSTIRDGEMSFASTTIDTHVTYSAFATNLLGELGAKDLVTVLDPTQLFCTKQEGCITHTDNKLLYIDDDHVNYLGSLLLEPAFQPLIDALTYQTPH